jgi:hypothetical protein
MLLNSGTAVGYKPGAVAAAEAHTIIDDDMAQVKRILHLPVADRPTTGARTDAVPATRIAAASNGSRSTGSARTT